jgi:hypothetical protein
MLGTKECVAKIIELYGDHNWKRLFKRKNSNWTERIFVSKNDPTHFACVSVSDSHEEVQDCFTGECKLPFPIDKYKDALVSYCKSQEFINDWLSHGDWANLEEMLEDSELTIKDFELCKNPKNWHFQYDRDPSGNFQDPKGYTYGFHNSKSEIFQGWVEINPDGTVDHYWTEND